MKKKKREKKGSVCLMQNAYAKGGKEGKKKKVMGGCGRKGKKKTSQGHVAPPRFK